eukprot:1352769-Rhodomonas_salina.1
MFLRACNKIPGTELGYGGTRGATAEGLTVGKLDRYKSVSRCPVLTWCILVLAYAETSMWYALATRCPVLRWTTAVATYAMSGTDLAYVPTRSA